MFKMEFTTDNAAFDGSACSIQCAEILRSVADKIGNGVFEGTLRDVNGNTIGSWSVEQRIMINDVYPPDIQRVEQERTIDLERYQDDGHDSRFDYLLSLAEDHEKPVSEVIELAETLGAEEDFDALPIALEDGGNL